MTNQLLRVKEAARFLAISERTLYTLTQRKKIPVIKFRGNVRYSLTDLEIFIQQARKGGGQ